jgi:hypothetical protein
VFLGAVGGGRSTPASTLQPSLPSISAGKPRAGCLRPWRLILGRSVVAPGPTPCDPRQVPDAARKSCRERLSANPPYDNSCCSRPCDGAGAVRIRPSGGLRRRHSGPVQGWSTWPPSKHAATAQITVLRRALRMTSTAPIGVLGRGPGRQPRRGLEPRPVPALDSDPDHSGQVDQRGRYEHHDHAGRRGRRALENTSHDNGQTQRRFPVLTGHIVPMTARSPTRP